MNPQEQLRLQVLQMVFIHRPEATIDDVLKAAEECVSFVMAGVQDPAHVNRIARAKMAFSGRSPLDTPSGDGG